MFAREENSRLGAGNGSRFLAALFSLSLLVGCGLDPISENEFDVIPPTGVVSDGDDPDNSPVSLSLENFSQLRVQFTPPTPTSSEEISSDSFEAQASSQFESYEIIVKDVALDVELQFGDPILPSQKESDGSFVVLSDIPVVAGRDYIVTIKGIRKNDSEEILKELDFKTTAKKDYPGITGFAVDNSVTNYGTKGDRTQAYIDADYIPVTLTHPIPFDDTAKQVFITVDPVTLAETGRLESIAYYEDGGDHLSPTIPSLYETSNRLDGTAISETLMQRPFFLQKDATYALLVKTCYNYDVSALVDSVDSGKLAPFCSSRSDARDVELELDDPTIDENYYGFASYDLSSRTGNATVEFDRHADAVEYVIKVREIDNNEVIDSRDYEINEADPSDIGVEPTKTMSFRVKPGAFYRVNVSAMVNGSSGLEERQANTQVRAATRELDQGQFVLKVTPDNQGLILEEDFSFSLVGSDASASVLLKVNFDTDLNFVNHDDFDLKSEFLEWKLTSGDWDNPADVNTETIVDCDDASITGTIDTPITEGMQCAQIEATKGQVIHARAVYVYEIDIPGEGVQDVRYTATTPRTITFPTSTIDTEDFEVVFDGGTGRYVVRHTNGAIDDLSSVSVKYKFFGELSFQTVNPATQSSFESYTFSTAQLNPADCRRPVVQVVMNSTGDPDPIESDEVFLAANPIERNLSFPAEPSTISFGDPQRIAKYRYDMDNESLKYAMGEITIDSAEASCAKANLEFSYEVEAQTSSGGSWNRLVRKTVADGWEGESENVIVSATNTSGNGAAGTVRFFPDSSNFFGMRMRVEINHSDDPGNAKYTENLNWGQFPFLCQNSCNPIANKHNDESDEIETDAGGDFVTGYFINNGTPGETAGEYLVRSGYPPLRMSFLEVVNKVSLGLPDAPDNDTEVSMVSPLLTDELDPFYVGMMEAGANVLRRRFPVRTRNYLGVRVSNRAQLSGNEVSNVISNVKRPVGDLTMARWTMLRDGEYYNDDSKFYFRPSNRSVDASSKILFYRVMYMKDSPDDTNRELDIIFNSRAFKQPDDGDADAFSVLVYRMSPNHSPDLKGLMDVIPGHDIDDAATMDLSDFRAELNCSGSNSILTSGVEVSGDTKITTQINSADGSAKNYCEHPDAADANDSSGSGKYYMFMVQLSYTVTTDDPAITDEIPIIKQVHLRN